MRLVHRAASLEQSAGGQRPPGPLDWRREAGAGSGQTWRREWTPPPISELQAWVRETRRPWAQAGLGRKRAGIPGAISKGTAPDPVKVDKEEKSFAKQVKGQSARFACLCSFGRRSSRGELPPGSDVVEQRRDFSGPKTATWPQRKRLQSSVGSRFSQPGSPPCPPPANYSLCRQVSSLLLSVTLGGGFICQIHSSHLFFTLLFPDSWLCT